MLTPLPHQIAGAEFLAARQTALLADAPRVGKTGAAILAADMVGAERILVVTTASGRAVWNRAFKQWSVYNRNVHVAYLSTAGDAGVKKADVVIIGWAGVINMPVGDWDLIILDESHYAKNFEAKRTLAVFGPGRLCSSPGTRVWCLTGTPIPNAPNDLYPMMRALCRDRLDGVDDYQAFLNRYCVVRKKRISPWKQIDVVVGGRNLDELKARLDGFWLRRTQQDVGITAPVYDLLPIHVSAAERRRIEAEAGDAAEILAAADTGETQSLEMHLGPIRRITGALKAAGVAEAAKDEFEGGLDKIVLMAWHREVTASLTSLLSAYNPVLVDGSTTPAAREKAQDRFRDDPECKVFVGQIAACGEAIDLSAAADLIFVESSFVPKDMAQAALRITNHGQKRQPRVRVAALEGSIDEALQEILLRKVATNKQVMQ